MIRLEPHYPRYLRASSATIGISAHECSESGVGMSVIVLPKAWRGTYERQRTIPWQPENDQLDIQCYEGDNIELTFDRKDPYLIHKGQLLDELLNRMNHKRVIPDEPEQNMGGFSEEKGTIHAPLIEYGKQFSCAQESEPRQMNLDELHGLLNLLILVGNKSEYDLLIESTSPFFQPILHRQFLNEVQSNLKNIRLDYVQKREHLAMIRGRIMETSLASQSHKIECEYDEFSQETPLLVLIATALDLVVMQWGVRSSEILHEIKDLNKNLGQVLRKGMADVPSASPLSIHQRMKNFILPRHLQSWKKASQYALNIIERKGVGINFKAGLSEPMVYQKSSSHMWEQLISDSLESTGTSVNSGKNTPPAWTSVGNSRQLDLVANDDVVLDGKYKNPPQKLSNISMADRDQMFAYSYLMDPQPSSMVLCYPYFPDTDTGVNTVAQIGLTTTRGSDKICKLIALKIRFPTPKELSNTLQWNEWKSSVGTEISELSGL